MEHYVWLKIVHIVSATLLFGTGLGTAFFMWMAHRAGDPRAIAVTARHVVLADAWFTTPAVIVQPLTGVWMAWWLGLPLDLPWILAALALYAVAGVCWLPVVAIQLRVSRLARAAVDAGDALPAEYHRLMRRWFALGWPAFIAVLLVFWLMTAKPRLWG